jgi:hypothetical protein
MLAQDGIVLNEVQGELMISKRNDSKQSIRELMISKQNDSNQSHAICKMRGVLDTQAYRPPDLCTC